MDEPPVDDRGRQGHLARLRRLAGARQHADRRLPARARTAGGAGELALTPGRRRRALAWTDARRATRPPDEHPDGLAGQPARVPLARRCSRTCGSRARRWSTSARAPTAPQTNLGALLVDYGPGHAGDAQRRGDREHDDEQLLGRVSGAPDYDACYLEVSKPTTDVTQWRVTRGILDSSNRFGLDSATPLTPGAPGGVRLAARPQDHVFPAGHRIGVVLVANYGGLGIAQTTGATVTLDATVSRISLPIVGGYHGAARSRGFTPDVGAPVLTRRARPTSPSPARTPAAPWSATRCRRRPTTRARTPS